MVWSKKGGVGGDDLILVAGEEKPKVVMLATTKGSPN